MKHYKDPTRRYKPKKCRICKKNIENAYEGYDYRLPKDTIQIMCSTCGATYTYFMMDIDHKWHTHIEPKQRILKGKTLNQYIGIDMIDFNNT